MEKKRLDIICSPVRLSSTVFIKDENGMSSHKINNKELITYISQIDNTIEEVNLIGPIAYTRKIKEDICQEQIKKYKKVRFKINLRSK